MAASTHAPKNGLLQVSRHSQGDILSVDIVAIHGLGTTSPKTWEAGGDPACGAQRQTVNWLSDDDMLPCLVPSARILTFTWDSNYYKDAPIVRIQDVAYTLLRKLQDERDKKDTHSRPLIFIASCFGGLIVTRALEIANTKGSDFQKLVVATSGVVFLGSPLQGTRAGTAAQWNAMLAGILGKSPSQTLLSDLNGDTEKLRDTTGEFVRIINTAPMQTMTICFWETRKTQLAKAILPNRLSKLLSKVLTRTELILVAEDSACLLGRPSQQLHARHVMMNKFQGPEDENFKLVSGSIKRMVGEAKKITIAQREAVNIHNEHFMVPRRVNTVFTGREKEIKDLQQSLCPSHSESPATESKIYVIHGIGGAGKSEVALKFAHDNRSEFWGVFWLDASSENLLERGFVNVAQMCDLSDKSFEGARSWLQNLSTFHSWLLILDNADDPSLDYSLYLPSASKGHILITSRNPECADLQTAGKDCYERLSKETAVELLLKASKMDLSLYSTHDADARKVDAGKIVDLLGHHALAIVSAGASIGKGICDLGNYAKTFKKQRQRLLEISPDLERSTYGNVYATFEVSATYLSNRTDQVAIDALKLLNCHAFLSFSNFPETTFEEAWQNSRKILRDLRPSMEEQIKDLSQWHVDLLPSFMRQVSPEDEDLDETSLCQARSLLVRLSIVMVDLPTRMTRMHPVTHMWARDRLKEKSELTDARLGTLAVLCLAIRSPYQQEALWVQLQPHIESVKDFPPGDYSDRFHLHQCFFRLSWVLHILRADKAVVEMLRTCFIEADHFSTELTYCQDIQYLYGKCLTNYGNVKEAMEMLEHVFKAREKLAEDHPDRLASQHELARAYQANGQVGKAVELLEHVVKVQEKLAEDHPNRLASQHALARAYLANGQVGKAVELLEHVVKVQEKLAEDHPDRLASQHELARAYQANGQVGKAVELLEHVVKVQEKLAEDHPDRLASQHELARAYQANGQVGKAIELLEHVVKVEEKLAEDYPDRLASQHELARAYQADGQVGRAIGLLEHVVKVEEKLAEDHPSRLVSQRVLARAYRANEQIDKALKIESRLKPDQSA